MERINETEEPHGRGGAAALSSPSWAVDTLSDEQMDQVVAGMEYMGFQGGYYPFLQGPDWPLPLFLF